jgi:hypothetical protein
VVEEVEELTDKVLFDDDAMFEFEEEEEEDAGNSKRSKPRM